MRLYDMNFIYRVLIIIIFTAQMRIGIARMIPYYVSLYGLIMIMFTHLGD